MPNLPEGVYLANTLWTLVALVGFVVGFYSVMEAHRDAIALERSRKNGYRKLIASSAVWTEVVRMAVYALFLTAGLLSMAGPAPRNAHNPIVYMMVAAVSLNVLNSINGLRLRRILLGHVQSAVTDTDRETKRDEADAAREVRRDASDAQREVRHEEVLKK